MALKSTRSGVMSAAAVLAGTLFVAKPASAQASGSPIFYQSQTRRVEDTMWIRLQPPGPSGDLPGLVMFTNRDASSWQEYLVYVNMVGRVKGRSARFVTLDGEKLMGRFDGSFGAQRFLLYVPTVSATVPLVFKRTEFATVQSTQMRLIREFCVRRRREEESTSGAAFLAGTGNCPQKLHRTPSRRHSVRRRSLIRRRIPRM
jgi:hypothetical protein